MGLYKHMRELWNSTELKTLQRQRLIEWRKDPTSLRIKRPTRLDRARSLGYKAKQGIILVRQRVSRGGRQRPDIKKGRRSKHQTQRKIVDKSYQQVAEERAAKNHNNCEVLNSYYVGKDGRHYWYEVILVDRYHPNVVNDPNLSRIAKQRGRVHRGITSAGRKSRGLRKKGKGTEQIRPSRSAAYRRKTRKD